MHSLSRLALALLLVAGPALAQDQGELAKASQNPLGDLVSVPLQFNYLTGGGIPDGRTLLNLNVQPVFPIKIGSRWTLIARTIVPYLNTPVSDLVRVKGIGDIVQQFFLTPQKPGALVWGVGPVLSLPTATNDLARTGAWAAGPGVVLVAMPGDFVLGALVYDVWTFEDMNDDGRATNQLAAQPIVNYNLPEGWALAFVPIWTANWDADHDETWTIPLGLGISKVTAIGAQPVSLALHYFHNVARPDEVGAHQLRFAISGLFPSRRPPATAVRE